MGYADGASGRRRPLGPWQPITLADGERVGDIVVRMWKCAAITGIVTDEMGEPVVGVGVRVFRREFAGGRPRYIAGGRCDRRAVAHLSRRCRHVAFDIDVPTAITDGNRAEIVQFDT
jgi:hypothetical protein